MPEKTLKRGIYFSRKSEKRGLFFLGKIRDMGLAFFLLDKHEAGAPKQNQNGHSTNHETCQHTTDRPHQPIFQQTCLQCTPIICFLWIRSVGINQLHTNTPNCIQHNHSNSQPGDSKANPKRPNHLEYTSSAVRKYE